MKFFNFLFRISSVINKCTFMKNYWKRSDRKKEMPSHEPLSLTILPQKSSTGLTWYWPGVCKLPRWRLSYRKMVLFLSSDSPNISQVITKLYTDNLIT